MIQGHRELFRRSYDFVAVKHIRVTAKETIEPGSKIDRSIFRLFHLRSLYARRSIGVLGSKWANKMIAEIAPKVMPIETKPKLPKKQVLNGKQSKQSNRG